MLKDCHLLIGYGLLVLGLSEAAYLPDYEYIQGVGWLRLHIVPATWADAQLRCHLEDATLTAPTTSAIIAVMQTTMRAHRLAESSVFTDIYASNPKGDFTSIYGLPMSNITLQWAVGEPNNLGNEEDCLVMTGAGELADVSCSAVHPFFCLKRNTTSHCNQCNTAHIENECNCTIEANQCNTTQETTQCDTLDKVNERNSTIIIVNNCNNILEVNQSNTAHNENELSCTIEANQCDSPYEGYTFEPRTGSCYKVHNEGLPWRRAAMFCAAEHAHLAVINSDVESEVLKELFAKIPWNSLSNISDKYRAHIGFMDWNGQNQWVTIFGKVDGTVDRELLHPLAEFQHCLMALVDLNALCSAELPPPVLRRSFNGSLVYRLRSAMRDAGDATQFLDQLLSPAPTVYAFLNGEPIKSVFHKWANGEPSDPGVEICGSVTNEGLLSDVYCITQYYPFICETPLK